MSDKRELEHAAYAKAISYVRRYPKLPELFDRDPAYQAIYAEFRAEPVVRSLTARMVEHKADRRCERLLLDAQTYLNETQPKKIQAAYEALRASGRLTGTSGSVRLVVLGLYALMMETDELGGERVIASRRFMAALIKAQFGRAITDRAVSDAYKVIKERGIFDVQDGAGWSEAGAKSTQFSLVLFEKGANFPSPSPGPAAGGVRAREVSPAEDSCQPKRRGHVDLPEAIPPLTGHTRMELSAFRAERRRMLNLWKKGFLPEDFKEQDLPGSRDEAEELMRQLLAPVSRPGGFVSSQTPEVGPGEIAGRGGRVFRVADMLVGMEL